MREQGERGGCEGGGVQTVCTRQLEREGGRVRWSSARVCVWERGRIWHRWRSRREADSEVEPTSSPPLVIPLFKSDILDGSTKIPRPPQFHFPELEHLLRSLFGTEPSLPFFHLPEHEVEPPPPPHTPNQPVSTVYIPNLFRSPQCPCIVQPFCIFSVSDMIILRVKSTTQYHGDKGFICLDGFFHTARKNRFCFFKIFIYTSGLE